MTTETETLAERAARKLRHYVFTETKDHDPEREARIAVIIQRETACDHMLGALHNIVLSRPGMLALDIAHAAIEAAKGDNR